MMIASLIVTLIVILLVTLIVAVKVERKIGLQYPFSGYAEAYRECDPLNPKSCDEDTVFERKLAGGIVLSSAWMYDGNQWDRLPDMSTKRDRPACSLVESENGAVSNLTKYYRYGQKYLYPSKQPYCKMAFLK